MKNIRLIFTATFLMFVTIATYAQVVITMEQEAGVYKVPCNVNGAKMKFIFDTGAATVCLSESMAEYLLDNDYIAKEDILGAGASQVADGRIVDHLKINLKDVEISGLHLKNVEAVVVEGQRAPLLLGQSAIQKLGKVSIDGNKLIINNAEIDYYQRLTQLKQKAEYYDKIQSYSESMSIWEEYYTLLWERQHPQDDDYCCLGDRCMWTNQFQKAIHYYTLVNSKSQNANLLYNLGRAYFAVKNEGTSIYFLKEAANQYGYKDKFVLVAECYYYMAMNYVCLKQYNDASTYARQAIMIHLREVYPNDYNKMKALTDKGKIDAFWSYFQSMRVKDETLGEYCYYDALIYFVTSGEPHCSMLKVAANFGNTDALDDLLKYKGLYCY